VPLATKSLRFSQLPPPFSERQTPPLRPPSSIAAYTTSGFCGETARPILPMSSSGRPWLSSRQVLPPSVDLWMPDSGPPFMRAATFLKRWWVEA
jgi:hypothetical protein